MSSTQSSVPTCTSANALPIIGAPICTSTNALPIVSVPICTSANALAIDSNQPSLEPEKPTYSNIRVVLLSVALGFVFSFVMISVI